MKIIQISTVILLMGMYGVSVHASGAEGKFKGFAHAFNDTNEYLHRAVQSKAEVRYRELAEASKYKQAIEWFSTLSKGKKQSIAQSQYLIGDILRVIYMSKNMNHLRALLEAGLNVDATNALYQLVKVAADPEAYDRMFYDANQIERLAQVPPFDTCTFKEIALLLLERSKDPQALINGSGYLGGEPPLGIMAWRQAPKEALWFLFEHGLKVDDAKIKKALNYDVSGYPLKKYYHQWRKKRAKNIVYGAQEVCIPKDIGTMISEYAE